METIDEYWLQFRKQFENQDIPEDCIDGTIKDIFYAGVASLYRIYQEAFIECKPHLLAKVNEEIYNYGLNLKANLDEHH